MTDSQIVLDGGRTVAYTDIGDASGPCIFFFHGAPISRLHLSPMAERFRQHGLRAISPDRPAYGGSSPSPGRSPTEWPGDISTLADALGVSQFLVAGHSTGGAYAVACASSLSDRIIGGVVLGGVTDMAWPEAWNGYLEGRFEIGMMRAPDEQTALAMAIEHFGADGMGFLNEPFDWAGPDRELLADEANETALGAAVMEAFRQGIAGYAQDVYLEGRGWPFDPRRIRVPIEVVHGDQDVLVPLAHSRHTAELIPGARLRVLPGHGHLTTLAELPALAAEVLERSGRASR
jgi:pimeloyl-ACP methyl ester carboxylesterase